MKPVALVAGSEETKVGRGAVGSLLRSLKDSKLLLCFVPFHFPEAEENTSQFSVLSLTHSHKPQQRPSRLVCGILGR